MIFAIQDATYSSPLINYPILSGKYGAINADVKDPWCEHAIIEINSLEQLIELTKDTGHDIILCREPLDGTPRLMIYDNRLE